MASSTKRVFNEMATFEKDSCKFIDPSHLYIVKIQIDDILQEENLKQTLSAELYDQPEPLAIYFDNTCTSIYIIFSYVVENYYFPESFDQTYKHQYEGDHHLIVSKYVSKFISLLPGSKITAKIIEFETQIQMIIYLNCVIFNSSQNAMIKFSKGKIREDILQFRTQTELKAMLLDLSNVKWDSLPSNKKYGAFLKLKRKKNKISVSEFSGQFDDKDIKKILFD
jgi:hypothetical protein